jgi:hypothetical protein
MRDEHQTPWSPALNEKLAQIYFQDPKPSITEMAAALGRTPHATWTQISRLGMATPGAKVRRCLPCGRSFYSSWIGNRICSWCAESDELRCA